MTGFGELIELMENNKKYFKMYNEIRNHYEHIEERTKSVKKEFANPIYYLKDFGNIEDGNYSFGGTKYDISQNSIDTLKTIYENILNIINKQISDLGLN